MRRVVINSSCNNIIEKYPTRPKPIDLVVSLTTYKFRIEHNTLIPVLQHMFNQNFDKNVHYVVTVSKDDYICFSKKQLEFLDLNGVELMVVDRNLRPHLKYFYVMQKYRDVPIVTIDDDCLYEPNLLKSLWDSYQKYPNCVNARRCHRITVTKDNFVDKYAKWEKKVTNILEPSYMLFATGVGGVLYPPDILKISDECIDDIMKSITADDIYLKKREEELSIKVKWVEGNPESYENMPIFKDGSSLQMGHTNDDVVKNLNFKPRHNLYSRNPLNVILRCCDKVECVNINLCKNMKREFGNGKIDVIQTCVTTLIDSIRFAKDNGWDIRFTLVSDSLRESTLNFIKDVCSNKNVEYNFLESNPGNINSFKCCFEHALKQKDNEFILFVEDDYLCDKNAINEIMLFFNIFGDNGKDIWLNPTTDIGDNHIYTRNKDGTWYKGVTLPSSKNGIGIWWRQFNHSTSTFATSVYQLKKHKDTFDYMFTLSKLQQYERNKIYEQEMLFQPLYPLMQHYQKSKTMYWFDIRNQERERPFDNNEIHIHENMTQPDKFCSKPTSTFDNYLKYSLVISIDDVQLKYFYRVFDYNFGTYVNRPKKLCGIMDENPSFSYAETELKSKNRKRLFNIFNCMLGHQMCVRMAKALDWPWVVIFEDDACFDYKNGDINVVLDKKPKDAKILILGRTGVHKGSDRKIEFIDVNDDYMVDSVYGAHAYIVFREGYDDIMRMFNTERHADEMIIKCDKMYVTRKNFFKQSRIGELSHSISKITGKYYSEIDQIKK